MKKIVVPLFMAMLILFSAGCKKHTRVIIKTSMGDIHVELFDDKSPETVKNFLNYVDKKFYNGTIFHRVINNFMIQGGGMTPALEEKETDLPIQNEANNGLKNRRGTLAMARTPEIHSATSQFFINVVDNAFLDYGGPQGYGYCVFGEVTKGMDVVDRIKEVQTQTLGINQNVPIENIVIVSIRKE